MIILLYSLPLLVAVLFFPTIVAYLLLTHSMLNGLASRPFMDAFKFTINGINVFPLDFVLAAMVFLLAFHLFKRLIGATRARIVSKEAKIATTLVVLYFILHLGQFIVAYFESIPLQALIRMFSIDGQCLYFFLPIFFFKNEKQLKRLFYTVVAMSLVFPFGQMYLAINGSADVDFILHGQGTYRLGYGDFNVILAMGAIAFFVWEQKVITAALPLGGIIMLAHRSAYVGMFISLFTLSILKGKGLKSTLMFGLVGILVAGLLFVLQATVSGKILGASEKRLEETFKPTSTTVSRWVAISYAFDALAENPFFGLGYDGAYALRDEAATNARAADLLHSHNFVLQHMAAAGSIGVLLLLSIIFYALLCARRLIRMRDMENIGKFLFVSLLFFAIYSLMNTTLDSAGYIFWPLVGAVFWYHNNARLREIKNETVGLYPRTQPNKSHAQMP